MTGLFPTLFEGLRANQLEAASGAGALFLQHQKVHDG